MELSPKMVHCIQPLTNIAKHFILSVSQGYEHASDKSKQNPDAFSLIPQIIRTSVPANFFPHLHTILYSHYIVARHF